MFESAKQKETTNGSELTIGKWRNWDETLDSRINYKQMIFDGGNWCGAKEREVRVHLVCGWKNQILSVEETSTCFYEFKFSTPLSCII